MKLKFDNFVARLFELGFTEPELRETAPDIVEWMRAHPYVRSFKPPENLQTAISWLNIGGSSFEDYSITVQGLDPTPNDLNEWGEHDDEHGGTYSFGLMEPNDELLAALESGAEGFRNWFNTRPTFSFDAQDEEGKTIVQGIACADGKSYSGPGTIN